jgi:poly(A) polymerase
MQSPHYQAALRIVQTLVDAGYTAYFAGGWVRDRLLGRRCEDIDIATSAHPGDVRRLFKKTIAVGEAFGVIVVLMEGFSFEVASFRSEQGTVDGRHPAKVSYSTAQEDAQRRDFTVNGLFYDPLEERVLDYVNGQQDLRAKLIRTIGPAEERFFEDRLRMVRAVRFAADLEFEIVSETRQAIREMAESLFPAVSMERIWQELKKMAAGRHLEVALGLLDQLGLLRVIFPALTQVAPRALPSGAPPVAILPLLFPQATSNEYEALARYLKASKDELRWLLDYATGRNLLSQPEDLVAWARWYAQPNSEQQLQLLALLEGTSLETHRLRIERLAPHIARIQARTPLVTAAHLARLGIAPGPQMGELLRRAEAIAITGDLHEAAAVLERLKIKGEG